MVRQTPFFLEEEELDSQHALCPPVGSSAGLDIGGLGFAPPLYLGFGVYAHAVPPRETSVIDTGRPGNMQ